ncbi:hypothetical protein LCGC14_1528630 [marine sediment metagenome]|uniref:Uncharacterized protein n=1 Tax=marine sediment metagenome TaxID=412755 RepID=A0A0F9JHA9_9ZZZZ
MSSKSHNKNYKNVLRRAKDINDENSFDLSKLMIPFSKINSKERIEYIYLGHEKIPFNVRHPTYQILFRNEFVEAIRNINKRINFINGYTRFSTSF